MDIENTQSNNPDNNLHQLIQIRKKGRPKKIVEVTEPVIEVKESKNKKTSNLKEYHKQKYLENKDKAKERTAESQKRYREAYKLLVQMIEKNFNISQEIKDQVIKIVSV